MLKIYFLISFLLFFAVNIQIDAQDRDEEEEEEEKQDSVKTSLEEIVVTGTRSEMKIIDIPYSVFKVDKKEMTFGRDLNAKDLLQDVPGLFLQTRFGSEVRITIRGFGTRSNTGVRGIRILQDGIPESEPDGETTIDGIDYTSLGGVEVVKGNLSSLYPNSPGGVVNFLSDFNFSQNFVRLTSQFGSYNLSQNGLRMGAVNKNSRLFLSYTYKNYIGFREHGQEFAHLVNANYAAYLSSKTTLYILSNYARGLMRFPGALSREEYDQDPYQAFDLAVSSDFRRITQKGRLGVKYRTLWGKFNSNEFEVMGFGAIKDLQFTTITTYDIKYKYVLGGTVRYTNRTPIFKRDNEFTAGVDYNYVNGPLSTFNNVNGNKGDELQTLNNETQTNYGAFFENQVNISKGKLYFLLSGRYDKVGFVNDDELFGLRNSSRSFDRFTPKAALNYKLTPSVAMYTSYGLGFDTPSATELENYPFSSNNGLTTLNPDINSQNSQNFELGIKGDVTFRKDRFPYKTVFEFTFFRTKVNNEIIPFVIGDQVYFRNAASTNRLGLECGFKFKPIRRTDVIINYTFTDFKYDEYIARSYDATGNPIDVDYSGNRVPAVPQHLVNFILEGEPELAKNLELLLVFDADYVSKMFVDDQNTESDGAYLYANGLVGINYKTEKFSLIFSAGVKNFLNRKYVGFININANPELPIGQRRYYEPGEPRNYYTNLILSYRF